MDGWTGMKNWYKGQLGAIKKLKRFLQVFKNALKDDKIATYECESSGTADLTNVSVNHLIARV
jgi:hypothetical protein